MPILFYKVSGKKMAEIQGRLAVKRLEDAKKLEGVLDEETTKGETDVYSVVAEEERKQEIEEELQSIKEELTTDDIKTAEKNKEEK